ncbi:MAG: adenylyl-sulfate kinase, partial [Bdellovibrionales bacterium]|nr:adenylyl-sulfate kinase [Bdellovibrionales bacterium]
VTLGSVDDGKSTLIGRMLYDSGNLPEDQVAKIEQETVTSGLHVLPDFSLVTDGLLAEQEQKITIDVAYRYFRTPQRVFILADSPGHEQYTRNMATAASNAQVALLLIDARSGLTTQTKRHAFIASLLGIKRVIVLVNKMDLVDYSEDRFREVSSEFLEFSERLQFVDVQLIPVSALVGDNVVHRSEKMPWYTGVPVLTLLETLYVTEDENPIDFRYSVQYVIRPNQDYRGFAGQVLSGHIKAGDDVVVIPSGVSTKVAAIDYLGANGEESLPIAQAPQSITLRLEDEVDVSRGDMIVRSGNAPEVKREFEANVVWFSDSPLTLSKTYLVQHCSRFVKCKITDLRYRIDVANLGQQPAEKLRMNEIGRAHLLASEPLYFDPYTKNRRTGSFVLIDPENYMTVAVGMILERRTAGVALREPTIEPRSQFLHKEESKLTQVERELRSGHKAFTFWFTGLSGAGKSTLCKVLEQQLFERNRSIYWLDGDSVRKGLCRDLGFRREERRENLRRIAEVAKLFNDAGTIALCSFITPYQADQELVREIVGPERFRLVYLNAELNVCEERDPNGLYQKARAGEIKGFTGVDAPYEAPMSPDLVLNTGELSPDECLSQLLTFAQTLL